MVSWWSHKLQPPSKSFQNLSWNSPSFEGFTKLTSNYAQRSAKYCDVQYQGTKTTPFLVQCPEQFLSFLTVFDFTSGPPRAKKQAKRHFKLETFCEDETGFSCQKFQLLLYRLEAIQYTNNWWQRDVSPGWVSANRQIEKHIQLDNTCVSGEDAAPLPSWWCRRSLSQWMASWVVDLTYPAPRDTVKQEVTETFSNCFYYSTT